MYRGRDWIVKQKAPCPSTPPSGTTAARKLVKKKHHAACIEYTAMNFFLGKCEGEKYPDINLERDTPGRRFNSKTKNVDLCGKKVVKMYVFWFVSRLIY